MSSNATLKSNCTKLCKQLRKLLTLENNQIKTKEMFIVLNVRIGSVPRELQTYYYKKVKRQILMLSD